MYKNDINDIRFLCNSRIYQHVYKWQNNKHVLAFIETCYFYYLTQIKSFPIPLSNQGVHILKKSTRCNRVSNKCIFIIDSPPSCPGLHDLRIACLNTYYNMKAISFHYNITDQLSD